MASTGSRLSGCYGPPDMHIRARIRSHATLGLAVGALALTFAAGASRLRAIRELLSIGQAGLLTAFLAAFGRAIAEVGAIIIVGGNIRGSTRTMTTAIALETSKGDLPLAMGLGMVLLGIVIALNAAAQVVKETAQRRYG